MKKIILSIIVIVSLLMGGCATGTQNSKKQDFATPCPGIGCDQW